MLFLVETQNDKSEIRARYPGHQYFTIAEFSTRVKYHQGGSVAVVDPTSTKIGAIFSFCEAIRAILPMTPSSTILLTDSWNLEKAGIASAFGITNIQFIKTFQPSHSTGPEYSETSHWKLNKALTDAGPIDVVTETKNFSSNNDPSQTEHAKGLLYVAKSEFGLAEKHFRNAATQNPEFLPSHLHLLETQIVLGKWDEATSTLAFLEKTIPKFPPLSLFSSLLLAERGKMKQAKESLVLATQLGIGSSSAREAEVYHALIESDYDLAIDILRELTHVSAILTAKINEIGIRLSQEQNVNTALRLYTVANKAVKLHFRYKISLNAALAAQRSGNSQLALKWLSQCQQEYGGEFEKLNKIRAIVELDLQKNAKGNQVAS